MHVTVWKRVLAPLLQCIKLIVPLGLLACLSLALRPCVHYTITVCRKLTLRGSVTEFLGKHTAWAEGQPAHTNGPNDTMQDVAAGKQANRTIDDTQKGLTAALAVPRASGMPLRRTPAALAQALVPLAGQRPLRPARMHIHFPF